MTAYKMLLATPVLKWYLNQGLIVTRMYQNVEYMPMRCFTFFAHTMTQSLCGSDVVVAEICKLLAYSSYGSLLFNRSRHCNVVYTECPNKARTIANLPNFTKTEVIGVDLLRSRPSKRKWNLIYLFIWVYNCCRWQNYTCCTIITMHIPRKHYLLLCGDTDSIYYCLSKLSLQEAVRQLLTHWGRDEIDAILQTTFSNAFSWIKMFEFRLKFNWNLFPRVQLTITHHWFR